MIPGFGKEEKKKKEEEKKDEDLELSQEQTGKVTL